MPIKLKEPPLRKYEVTCDTCGEGDIYRAKSKIALRDTLRKNDWSWRDLGFLGIVECTCPECMKERRNDAN